jgi:hypothetical protein
VFGECELAIGDEPNKEAAIAAAMTPPAPAPAGDAAKTPAKPGAPAAGAAAAAAETEEAAAKRRRGTQPPPSPT